MKRWGRPVIAIATGVVWGLCFSPTAWTWAPWIAIAPTVVLLGMPRAAGLGLASGLAFWLTSIPWIAPTLVTFGNIPSWLAWPLLALLSAYLALFTAAFAGLGSSLWSRGSAVAALLGLPALWVALEWARAWLLSGFPWNLAAYAAVETPGVFAASAWIGAYGVSYLLLLGNTGLALAVARREWRLAAFGLLVPLTVLATADRLSARVEPDRVARPLEARVLQPNIANLTQWDAERVTANLSRLIVQSHEACRVPGTLLIWPESAAWPFVLGRDPQLDDAVAGLLAKGCPVLLNSIRRDGDDVFNAAYLVHPDGTDWYAKRHLVPWGEYVPVARFLPFVRSLARNAGDFSASEEIRLLTLGEQRLGAAICFEVVFPSEVADTVSEGATVLVSLTNDDWYGPTAAPWQHLRAARFRAAETRRTLLRAAITGVSAVVGPDGALLDSAGPGEERTLAATVRGRRDLSPYVRLAPWLPWLWVGGAAFAIFWSRRPAADSPGRRPIA